MDVIEEDGIQENAAKVGGVFIRELMKLQEEFEVIGDVRGKGLMLGVELVKNRVSTPYPRNTYHIAGFFHGLKLS